MNREQWTMNPEHWTLNPEPWIVNREPWTLNCEPWTLNSNPWNVNPGLWTMNRELWTMRLSQVCGTNPKDSISRLAGNCTTTKWIVHKVRTSLLEARFSRERVHISCMFFEEYFCVGNKVFVVRMTEFLRGFATVRNMSYCTDPYSLYDCSSTCFKVAEGGCCLRWLFGVTLLIFCLSLPPVSSSHFSSL